MLCAYEHAEWVSFKPLHFDEIAIEILQVVPIAQTLQARNRLAGIFINECQVLDRDTEWRNFGGMQTFFANCTRVGITCVVVFMTATLKVIAETTIHKVFRNGHVYHDVMQHPANVLRFCGFKPLFDRAVIVSPMRDNLTIELKRHPEGTTSNHIT